MSWSRPSPNKNRRFKKARQTHDDFHSTQSPRLSFKRRLSGTTGHPHGSISQGCAEHHLAQERCLSGYRLRKNQGDLAFAQACEYLNQGLDNGFVQAGELHTFLALRSGYPHHELPPLTPNASNEERLELLQRYLHDKESLT
jgi:hypothetical protein